MPTKKKRPQTSGEVMLATWERVQERLAKSKGEWNTIAKDCGVSYNWIRSAATGALKSPGVVLVAQMADYLEV
jgi:hypothetical protein